MEWPDTASPVLTLAQLVGRTRPRWALWGGSLVMFGLAALFVFGTLG